MQRANGMVRFLEKVRYKWRRQKTLVRLVVLRLDHIWSRAAVGAGDTGSPQDPRRPGKRHPTGQKSRRVA